METQWTEVDSSAVNRVGFNESESAIYVEFTRGAVYKYWPCSDGEFADLVESPSVGQHVNGVLAKEKTYVEVDS